MNEKRSVGVRRQVKAILFNGVSRHSDACTLELVVVGVPRLDLTGFSLNAVVGFTCFEAIELALVFSVLLRLVTS